MSRPSLRDRWLRVLDVTPFEVLACCPKITLYVISRGMDPRGYVTVDRAAIAEQQSVNESTITRHLRAARDAKLLDHVSSGHKGRHAVYRAMIPDADYGYVKRLIQRLDSGAAMEAAKGDTHGAAMEPDSGSTVEPPSIETDTATSSFGNGAVDDSGARDDAGSLVTADLQRVAPDSEARAHDGCVRSKAAGAPQGNDHAQNAISVRNDQGKWCKGCGGLLAVETGVVVDGRCVRCQKRRAEQMKIYEGSAEELAKYRALTASADVELGEDAELSELPPGVTPIRREDRK